jgi:hypothetical protein
MHLACARLAANSRFGTIEHKPSLQQVLTVGNSLLKIHMAQRCTVVVVVGAPFIALDVGHRPLTCLARWGDDVGAKVVRVQETEVWEGQAHSIQHIMAQLAHS